MEKQLSRQRLHQIRFQDRNRSHLAVSDAVKRGAIPKATELRCVYCGEPANEYHHFLGYGPSCDYAVWPACKDCHDQIPRLPRSLAVSHSKPAGYYTVPEAAQELGVPCCRIYRALDLGFRLDATTRGTQRWYLSAEWLDAFRTTAPRRWQRLEPTSPRALTHPKARPSKLTAAQAEEIRQRFAAKEPQKKLAAEFGVSVPMISAIVCGRAYTSAPMEASA